MMNLLISNHMLQTEQRIFETLLEGDFAGVILEPTRSTLPRVNEQLITELSKKYPLVLIDTGYPNINLPCVALDDLEGGYLATSHLLKKGHRNIFYF